MSQEPNKIDNNEPNAEQPQVLKSSNSADVSVPGKKIENGMYKFFKNLGNTFKRLGNGIKLGTQAVAKFVCSPVGIVTIVVASFLILVVIIINKFNLESIGKSISGSVDSLFSSWEDSESGLTTQQELAKTTYEKSGSLLDFSASDITTMVSDLEALRDSSSQGSDAWNLYENLLIKIGDGSTSDVLSPDDNVSIYQHILSIAKYDFNNVKWKRYGHGYDGEDSPMTVDSEQGVTYPSDENGTTYETFSSLLRPYLLSYEIPQAFYAGLLDNENVDTDAALKLTYNFIKYGLSDITVNRYDVQKYIEQTYYLDYDYTYYHSSFYVTITTNDEGALFVNVSSISEVQEGDTQHCNTRLDDSGQVDVMKETSVSVETPITNKYYISTANVFDYKYNYEYKYVKYSETDAANRVNSDTEVPEETVYNPTINEENIITTVYGASYSADTNTTVEDVIADIESKYGVTLESSSDGKYYFKGSTYEKRDGKQVYITRTWSDTLSQSSSSSSYYSVDDLIEFNESTDAGTVSSEDFNADTDSVEYYDSLVEKNKLNRMDFINSNPNIFDDYIEGKPYKKYVGINRENLEDFCYGNLVELWQDLENTYTTYPYKYGITYGFTTSSSTNSSSYLSGVSLLKQYIHTFEGDGSFRGGGRYDADYNKISEYDTEAETVYYKVYNAKDDSVDLTVGYGVDLEAQKDRFAELGIDVSTVQEYDYIEAEIVDKIEDDVIQDRIEYIKDITNGIELTEYQIHALVSHSYLAGNITGFVTAYNQYWNEESDDKYEELYEKYKDTPEDSTTIMSEIDFDNGIYDAFFSFYNSQAYSTGGYETRARSEYTLFSGGYYSTLKRFYGSSAGTPGDIQLIDGDTIDAAACLELQIWFEDNVFGFPENLRADQDVYSADWGNTVTTSQNQLSYLTEEYLDLVAAKKNYYQCPWWSSLRANIYLRDMGSDKRLTTFSDGRTEAETAASELGISVNYEIDNIQPYSIISFDRSGSSNGHTGFVEAVTSDYIVVSQCASGLYWCGVAIVPKSELEKSSSTYYFVSSVCITDALD